MRAVRYFIFFSPLLSALCLAQTPESIPGPPIQSVPELQEIISRTARQVPDISTEALREGVRQLTESAKNDRRLIYEQLLLFHGVERPTNRWAADFGVGLFLRELPYSTDESLSIVLPILQRADPYWTKRIERAVLDGAMVRSPNGTPDFVNFENFIRSNRATSMEQFRPFFRYMYSRSPIETVRTIEALDGEVPDLEPILRSLEHRYTFYLELDLGIEKLSDEELRSTLASLSRRPQWWLRAFVASVLKKNPRFATGDLIDSLQADLDPLVNELAKAALAARSEMK